MATKFNQVQNHIVTNLRIADLNILICFLNSYEYEIIYIDIYITLVHISIDDQLLIILKKELWFFFVL